jgi:YD repeat-containing protein
MDSEALLSRICRLPQEFRHRGDVSMANLLRESGYADAPRMITEELLERYFRANADAIDAWLLLSMDQRSSSGWYLLEPSQEAGQWTVSYHENGRRSRETSYDDDAKACAVFAKQWLESIKGIANG